MGAEKRLRLFGAEVLETVGTKTKQWGSEIKVIGKQMEPLLGHKGSAIGTKQITKFLNVY